MRAIEGISCPNRKSSILQFSLMDKQWEKGTSSGMKEVNENGESMLCLYTFISHPIVDETSQHVRTLKVLAICVEKWV